MVGLQGRAGGLPHIIYHIFRQLQIIKPVRLNDNPLPKSEGIICFIISGNNNAVRNMLFFIICFVIKYIIIIQKKKYRLIAIDMLLHSVYKRSFGVAALLLHFQSQKRKNCVLPFEKRALISPPGVIIIGGQKIFIVMSWPKRAGSVGDRIINTIQYIFIFYL